MSKIWVFVNRFRLFFFDNYPWVNGSPSSLSFLFPSVDLESVIESTSNFVLSNKFPTFFHRRIVICACLPSMFIRYGQAKRYGPLFKYTLWLIRCLGCLEYIVLSANAFTAIFLRLFTYNLQSPQALLSLWTSPALSEISVLCLCSTIFVIGGYRTEFQYREDCLRRFFRAKYRPAID